MLVISICMGKSKIKNEKGIHFTFLDCLVFKKLVTRPRYQSCPDQPIRMCIRKQFSFFLNQTISCGYSKEIPQRDGSFEHPKHMLKSMGMKIVIILHS